jgi:hypothetical protein
MNKQLIVFLCFNNVDHIKQSFDSMYCDDIDYFVVENISNYSEEIKNYFLDKKKTCNSIVGYIQFQKNISGNAINVFIRKYGDFLRKYEYITFTDGDYYVYDIKSTIQEILLAFNHPDCAISSADLYQGNQLNNPNKMVGTQYYDEFMKSRSGLTLNNIIGIGIPSLMTLQKKDLYILESIYYYDGNIRNKVRDVGKQWYITTKNLTYCLTCDISYAGHPYFDWKRSVGYAIWQITEEANYIEIIK